MFTLSIWLQDAIGEVNLAYDDAKSVDVLDLSPKGSQSWEAAKRRYEERIDRVEARITTRLRDQLGQVLLLLGTFT